MHAYFSTLESSGGRRFAVTQVPVAREAVREDVADIAGATAAVVDVGLEPIAAVELCEEMHARAPALPIAGLLCCPHSVTPWNLRALVGAGVAGLIDLQASRRETVRALRSVARGGSVLHLDLRRGPSSLLSEFLVTNGRRTHAHTSLLELVAQGLPDHEIGKRLHLSPHTVKHHIERLRQELRVRNRIELAAWAGRHGLYRRER